MKRLSLKAFEAKKTALKRADQLLGQVLGNCHDTPDSEASSEDPGPDVDTIIL